MSKTSFLRLLLLSFGFRSRVHNCCSSLVGYRHVATVIFRSIYIFHKFTYKKLNFHNVPLSARFCKHVKNWSENSEIDSEIEVIGIFFFAAQNFLHECAPLSKTMLRALEIVWTCRSCSFILLLKMKSDPSALEMSTNVLG